jgi:hypothetical protein
VHDVLAAFTESIQTDKERVCGDFPLVLALSLVVKVSFLETGAHINAHGKTVMSFLGVLG